MRMDLIFTGGITTMKRLTTLAAGLTLALLTFGCGGGDSDNKAGTNTNVTVVNNNTSRNAGTTMNTNANANANRGAYNANISQEDYEKDKDTFGQKAKDLGDKVGTGLSDGWLWVKTRGALIAVDDLEESTINVDVNNGVITLRGTVPNKEQVQKADTAAKGISGNKGVQNQLKVGASSGGNANAAKKK
jgi:osmotically-inducible protein OsmY